MRQSYAVIVSSEDFVPMKILEPALPAEQNALKFNKLAPSCYKAMNYDLQYYSKRQQRDICRKIDVPRHSQPLQQMLQCYMMAENTKSVDQR